MERRITEQEIEAFVVHLRREERSRSTIEKYGRAVRDFARWLNGREVSKELTAAWKESLRTQGYAPGTVNGMLAAVHRFYAYSGWTDCAVRYLKIQRQIFTPPEKELTREEYARLVSCAERRGDLRLALLLETLAATGIRVSELKFITVEAVRREVAEISMKGKIRTILIPGRLCGKLEQYAHTRGIAGGVLFLSNRGRPLDRKEVWAQMKAICRYADVDPEKVFPHNLRHLFARSFYGVQSDIVKLADVLGHSSIETTRGYLRSTATEHRAILEQMRMVK